MLWRLPMGPAYDELIRSNNADMREAIGGQYAGPSITAQQFLAAIIEKNMVWAHPDIAGVAWQDHKHKPLIPELGNRLGRALALNHLIGMSITRDVRRVFLSSRTRRFRRGTRKSGRKFARVAGRCAYPAAIPPTCVKPSTISYGPMTGTASCRTQKSGDGDPARQPVLIMAVRTKIRTPPAIFIFCRRYDALARENRSHRFERIVALFDGRDGEALSPGRARPGKTPSGVGGNVTAAKDLPPEKWEKSGLICARAPIKRGN